ncbi:MAG: hypothetical protein HZB31_08705 [Nitrospirae bacterium]|nr:hypothetical protein [Nitrospirota bacterium]
MTTKKKQRRSFDKVRLPLSWRVSSILAMLPLGYEIFMLIFRKSGGKFPLAAGDSTDPIFFASVFSIVLPCFFYLFVVDKILRGIVARRAGSEIAIDVAKDLGKAAAEMAAEVVLGGGSSDDRSSSSGGSTKGGGGEFGGGGSSGGY